MSERHARLHRTCWRTDSLEQLVLLTDIDVEERRSDIDNGPLFPFHLEALVGTNQLDSLHQVLWKRARHDEELGPSEAARRCCLAGFELSETCDRETTGCEAVEGLLQLLRIDRLWAFDDGEVDDLREASHSKRERSREAELGLGVKSLAIGQRDSGTPEESRHEPHRIEMAQPNEDASFRENDSIFFGISDALRNGGGFFIARYRFGARPASLESILRGVEIAVDATPVTYQLTIVIEP
jgi:hypothetical protein